MTESPRVKPSFGFGDLDDIQPRRPHKVREAASPSPALEPAGAHTSRRVTDSPGPRSAREADEAAARLGFGSREPLIRRRKRQPIEEPVEQINLRAAVADINVFVEWCERKRYSYREGFSELVKFINAEGS